MGLEVARLLPEQVTVKPLPGPKTTTMDRRFAGKLSATRQLASENFAKILASGGRI